MASTANTAVQGNTSLTIQGTANEIEVTGGGVTLGSGGTVTVGLPDDVSLGGSLTIAQNLTVNGTTTTVNTDTLSVEDPLIELARDNSENSVDVGLYGKYSLDSGVTTKYSGLFKDASDSDKFKLFKGLEAEPTSTVDTAGTGYTKGDLVINDLDAVTISGNLTGNVTGDLTGDSSGTHTGGVVGNVTGNVTGNLTGDVTGDVTGDLTGSVLTAAQTNITSVGTLSSLSVSGDLTVDTNTLYVDSSNNRVGIGTSSPSSEMTVNGQIEASSDTTTPSGGNAYFYKSSAGAVVSGYSTIIETGGLGSRTERLRVDNSGNIGIGTTSPSFPLEVDGGTGDGVKIKAGNTSNDDSFLIANSSDTTLFVVDGGGQVGIGTSSPDSLLNIEGSRNNAILTIGNSTNDSSWTTGDKLGAINFYSADTSGAGSGVKASLSYEVAAGTSSATNAMVFRTAGTTSGTNNIERLRIDSSGNLILRNSSLSSPTSGFLKEMFIVSDDGTGTFAINGASNGAYGDFQFITRKGDSSDPITALTIESTGDIKFNLDSITDTRSLNFPYYNASNAKTEIKTTATGDFRQHFDILMNTAQSDSAPTSVFRIQNNGNVGIGVSSPSGGKLQIDTGVTSLNQGIPATSGTSQNGILRLTAGAGTYGETLDIGVNVGTTYAWIQPTNKDNLSCQL